MNLHLSSERLRAAAEGRDLDRADSEHLASCPECVDILSMVTRQQRNAEMQANRTLGPGHVSIRELWDFVRGIDLDETGRQHLSSCESCLGILGFCRTRPSLHQVIWALKDSGFNF